MVSPPTGRAARGDHAMRGTGKAAARHGKTADGYRRSFTINTLVGSALLLAAVVFGAFANRYPALQGGASFGFMPITILCYFVASLHYAKYLSLSKGQD
jgi:hypothetical protein